MTCIICGNRTTFFLEKDGYAYQKCSSCGLVFVHPQPHDKYLDKEIYSEKSGYQSHKKKDLSTVKEFLITFRNTIFTVHCLMSAVQAASFSITQKKEDLRDMV